VPQAALAVAAAFSTAAAAVTAVTSTVVLGLTVGTWLTLGAVGLSVGMAMSAAAEAKKAAKGLESSGQQLQLKAAGDSAPVPFLFGRSATGGFLVYRDTYGSKNSELAMLTVLSGGGPIAGVESYSPGEYGVAFAGNPNSTLASVTGTSPASDLYTGKMRQRWLTGASTDGAPPTYSGQPLPGLSSASKLSGLAHVLMLCSYDTKRYPSGLPSKNLWVANGLKLYDPRKDSTYPGGSGSQRWGQPSTYAFSENPGVAALNWSLGIFDNGVRVGGIGAPMADIDVPAFVSMANICDANNWKIGGVVTSDDNKFSVLNALLQAGGAVAVARGAQLSVIVNAPVASVYTLGTDDIVGTVELTNSAGWRDRKNTIVPRYRAESQGWELIAGETVSAATYVTEDGAEVRSTEVQYSLVQQAAQAHQLAAYDMVNGREFLQATVVCKPRLLGVRVGDAITVNVPDVAITGKKMLVVGRSLDPASLQVTLNLRSETDAKHAYALGQSQTAPPSPTFNGYDPSNPAAPGATAWAITGNAVVDAGGVSVPAIVVEGQSDDPNAASVIVEYRQFAPDNTASDDFGWSSWSETPAATTTKAAIVGALYPDTAYQVSLSYRTVRGVVSKRLILGPVTVGQSVAGGVVDGGIDWQGNTIINVPPALQTDANGMLSADFIKFDGAGMTANAIANAVAAVSDFEQQLSDASNAALQAGTSVLNLRTYTDNLVFTNGVAVGTAIINEAAARQAQDAVIANSITGLQVRLVSNVATLTGLVSNEANARVAADGVLTTSIDTVAARLNSNTVTLTGLVTNEVNARANAVAAETAARSTAISQVYTAIGSNTSTVTGLINSEATTRANADAAETTARNSAISQVYTAIGANTTALQASITNLSTTTTNANNALSSRIEGLSATVSNNFNNLDGRVTSAVNAQASANSVMSGRVDGLSSTITGNFNYLDGRITTAINTAASANSVTATRIDNLSASLTNNFNTLNSSISNLQTATVTNTNALAGQITTLNSNVGGISATVSGQASAITNLQGRTEAYLKWTAAAGGQEAKAELTAGNDGSLIRLVASKLALATNSGGVPYDILSIIGTVVRFSRPVEISVGSATLCLGPGFGASNDLLMWFGPAVAQSAMTKGNATFWMDTGGAAYFGGALLSGTLSNSSTGTETNVPVSNTLGPFGTNGNPIGVNWSYTWTRQGYRTGNSTPSGGFSAVVRLYRTIAGGAETLVDTKTVTGSISYEYDAGEGITSFLETASQGFTYTDTAGGTQARTYRVEVASRSSYSVPGGSSTLDGIVQRYGIATRET